jgi:predicted phage terminase large subunit-like protein
VIGRLLNADKSNWRELNVPAICVDEENDALGRSLGESHWPEFFPVGNLEAIKKSIGERDFNALYQGQPAGDAGAIFKEHWLETFDKQQKYSYIYATIDTAYKAESMNDFTAICVWGLAKDKTLKLVHVVMERMEFPDLQKLIPKIIKQWKIRCVYIEGRANGVPLIQSLKTSLAIQIKELVPSKDKVLRANSVAPLVEEGVVSLYENIPNLQDRINELTSFPFIKNDDFVDAFVYGVTVYRDELMGGKTSSGGIRTTLPKLTYDASYLSSASRKSATLDSLLGDRRNTRNAGGVRYL